MDILIAAAVGVVFAMAILFIAQGIIMESHGRKLGRQLIYTGLVMATIASLLVWVGTRG